MLASKVSTRFRPIAIAALLCVAAFPAVAHDGNHVPFAVPQPPEADAPMISADGILHALQVENSVTGVAARYLWLQVDNGSTIALRGSLDALTPGQHVELAGRNTGQTLFVSSSSARAVGAVAAKAATGNAPTPLSVQGKLAVAHADFFDQNRGEFRVVVISADGGTTTLKLPVVPETLQIGMSVIVKGTLDADGSSLDATDIVVVASPGPVANDIAAAPITNNVLVMAVKFTDSPASDPFTPATINTEFQTKVAALYQEQSYGQQLLNVTVACYTTPVPAGCAVGTAAGGWLRGLNSQTHLAIAKPASCNFTAVGQAADAAATQAGYNLASYANRFYIMPSDGSCNGWAGLAYVGWPYQAWGNGYYQLWVSGHEIGHNFTLWHAGNLTCPSQQIGPGCVNGNEYGDPFDTMGNIHPGHFNSAQKSDLGWLPAGTVKTHTTGTATYTLSPLELPGQSTYAVKIAAASNRVYWIEYRQQIGFDIGSATSNGAQIRVANPLQFPCSSCGGDDTEILDMTPATPGNFGDAALPVGQTFTDSTYGTSIHVISATASALTISVSAPGASPAPTLASATSRKTHGAAGVFDLPLSLVATNPTTEPRQGPAQTIVFDFGKPITAATVAITEGSAVAAAPSFSGNTVVVNLTGVTNGQYVTVTLSNVSSADGGTGGMGSVRTGFLVGDVNQSRTVTVADLGLINAALAQPVTAANYLKDVNASGTLTVADKALTDAHLATALPAP